MQFNRLVFFLLHAGRKNIIDILNVLVCSELVLHFDGKDYSKCNFI